LQIYKQIILQSRALESLEVSILGVTKSTQGSILGTIYLVLNFPSEMNFLVKRLHGSQGDKLDYILVAELRSCEMMEGFRKLNSIDI